MKLYSLVALSAASLVSMFINTIEAQTSIEVRRTEGDTNEFIPCQFTDGNIPFWKINDTFYHHTRLPCPFVVSTPPNGINIALLERSISGTSFQCFASTNGVIMADVIRDLIVNESPNFAGDGEEDNTTLTLDLLYQQVRFTEGDISLRWSLFNKNDVVESPPGSSSVVYNSTCDVSNASVAANTTNTYTILSPREEYEDDYFNIIAFDENREQIGTVDEPITINSGVKTTKFPQLFIGRTCPVCIPVPEPTEGPFFNIPRSPTSNQRDSLCKAVRTPEETDRCVNLTSCPDFPSSPLSSSITVCSSTPSTTDYQMCLSNITREMNGTKIHFFYSSRPNCQITGSRQRQSLFIASYEIMAEDSSVNVTVTTNTSSGELRLASLPRGCYATTVYNISISDVTGSLVYTGTNIQDDVCTQVNQLQTPECAPYTIAVDAYNPHVTYQTVYHTVGEDLSSSFCDCAHGKAEVELTKSAISEIKLTCDTNTDTNLKFSIIVVDMETESKVFSSDLVSCTTRTVPIQNLACNTEYSVSAHFAFGNGTVTDCLLSTTTINFSTDCPTTIGPTISPTVVPVVAIAVSVIVVVLVLIVIVIIVILVIVCYRKKSSGVYRPSRKEHQQSRGQTAMEDMNNDNQTEEGRGFKLNNETEIKENEEP